MEHHCQVVNVPKDPASLAHIVNRTVMTLKTLCHLHSSAQGLSQRGVRGAEICIKQIEKSPGHRHRQTVQGFTTSSR